MKTYAMIFLILSLLFTGCNANHCITLGGGKGDIQGEITYCISAPKTKEHKVPVVETNNKEYYGLDLGQINTIINQIEKNEKPKAIAKISEINNKEAIKQHPVKKLLKLIQRE